MNKTIQSVSGTNTIMIAVGDLRAGIYIVSLSDGAKTLVDKLIKYN
jgi:predicted phage gp36 major capsid-like protein